MNLPGRNNLRNMLLNPGLKPYWMALVAILVLAGCGGHNTTPPPMSQHFLYGQNAQQSSNTFTFSSVYGFSEDDRTGALSALPGSPFTVGPAYTFSNGFGLATDSQGRFLFISSLLDAICCYRGLSTVTSLDSKIGTVSSSPITTVNGGTFTTDPSGKFLYIASTPSFTRPECFGIDGHDLSTPNLSLIPGSPFSSSPFLPLDCVEFVSVSPGGHYLYAGGGLVVPAGSPHPIFAVFSIDSNTGTLTLVSRDNSPGVQPVGPMLFQPSGKFMYALDTRAAGPVVDLYSVNPSTGSLTFLSTQVNNGLVNPIMTSSGNFLYGCMLFSGQPCQPVAYRVDSNTGALTPISGFSLGAGKGDTLILDKSGKYAYALNASFGQSSNQIFVYSVDSFTGLMTQIPSLTTTVPTGIANIVAGR